MKQNTILYLRIGDRFRVEGCDALAGKLLKLSPGGALVEFDAKVDDNEEGKVVRRSRGVISLNTEVEEVFS